MIYKRWLRLFCAGIFALFACVAFANNPVTSTDTGFDAASANQTLDKLSIQLSVEKLNVAHLQNAIRILSNLQIGAKICVTDVGAQLEDINKQLIDIKESDIRSLTMEQQYLQSKKNELNAQLSECRLYLLRSDEAISAFSSAAQKMVATELFIANPPIWQNIINLPQQFHAFMQTFNAQKIYNNSGIKYLTLINICILLLALIISIIIAARIKVFAKHQLTRKDYTLLGFRQHIWQIGFTLLSKYCILLAIAIVLVLFSTILHIVAQTWLYIGLISYSILSYLICLLMLDIVAQLAKIKARIPANIIHNFIYRSKLLISLCLAAVIIYIVLHNQILPTALLQFLKTIFVSLLIINLITCVWPISQLPKIRDRHRVIYFLITGAFIFIFGSTLLTEWLGYHALSYYLLHGVIITLISSILAWSLYKLSSIGLTNLSDNKKYWQLKLRDYLGLKEDEVLVELICLRIVVYLLLWCGLLLLLLKAWGLSSSHFQELTQALINGIEFSKLHFIPLRIVLAIVIFILLASLTRLLRTYVLKRPSLIAEQGSRTALAAIMGYVGFAVAIIFALLMAGVDFAGLAIIAGALSVGIGFGLQNIVSNFVSGIILLIERPIKPGDRIVVGNTEGYVSRISIRSTHIKTLERFDVLVPNSELITKQVANLTFRDLNYQLKIILGIAYGSDTLLAKKLLLEIANAHPQVVNNLQELQPRVYFLEFAENSLSFELVCLIHDVNMKSEIKSDMNFAIDAAFREHNIAMPFPQRDITIRNWPSGKDNS